MKNLGTPTKSSEASFTSRIQAMEEKCSDIEEKIEEMESFVKEYAESETKTNKQKTLAHNIQEIWDSIKRQY